MIISKESIKQALHTKLPGQTSHYKMLPPGRILQAPPHDKSLVKKSAVLLLLFIEENQLKVCLIKRPSFMKHHAGQVALPGGRIEEGETPDATALRETWEEIGIKPENISLLGRLSEFYVQVSCFEIVPVVGWINQAPSFKLNAAEVEKIILFPIERFKLPFDETEMVTLTGTLTVPCIKFNDEIIWGATAMILSEFADLLTDIDL